jgi:hypothetical protein
MHRLSSTLAVSPASLNLNDRDQQQQQQQQQRMTMLGYDFASQDKILNVVWMGIVGVEVAMVLGVVFRAALKRVASRRRSVATA